MTRWLDDDEQRIWRNFLAMTQLVNERLDRQLQRDSGMPHTYYMILVALSEADDRAMRMTDLARRAQSSQSRLSHAVARLEERGWVRRTRCADDRRGNTAVLTDDGFAALAAAAHGHVEEVRQALFDALTAEQLKALDDISTAVRGQTVGGSS
ncbi:MarR family winged helix-turn-helix transcriptional regulator [Nonomuraea typhae]|uniref:MarR family winged helix-turn-helix transcriptional regulator n=1 Tax=Nonomuraea typhae TaxID=2603600 RepID=UPI0012FB1A50|nr:MarR family transcriptional regulator [Nonomuraea typhae]